jgi:hypothetical protein
MTALGAHRAPLQGGDVYHPLLSRNDVMCAA